jgi:hypothetical protein
MSQPLKPGDRVRVTHRYRGNEYQPGDKRIIWSGPKLSADGTLRYYHVAMDGPGPAGTTAILTEDEIEPDV